MVEQSTFDKSKALAEFMEYIHTYLTDDECDQVLKAFELADKAHEGQFRASGEPYIMHPLAVADILAHLQIDILHSWQLLCMMWLKIHLTRRKT